MVPVAEFQRYSQKIVAQQPPPDSWRNGLLSRVRHRAELSNDPLSSVLCPQRYVSKHCTEGKCNIIVSYWALNFDPGTPEVCWVVTSGLCAADWILGGLYFLRPVHCGAIVRHESRPAELKYQLMAHFAIFTAKKKHQAAKHSRHDPLKVWQSTSDIMVFLLFSWRLTLEIDTKATKTRTNTFVICIKTKSVK